MNTTPVGNFCLLDQEPKRRAPRKRNRRRKRTTVLDFVERSLQNEFEAVCLFRAAADKAHGPTSSLLRRLAHDEEFHVDFLERWFSDLHEGEQNDRFPRWQADKERIALAAKVTVAQMPSENAPLLDFVIDKKRKHREFYLQQRYHLKGRKLRTTLLDLADEESIHLNQLLQAAGRAPLPRLEVDELETVH